MGIERKKNPKAKHDEFAQVSSLRGQHVWRQWECNETPSHYSIGLHDSSIQLICFGENKVENVQKSCSHRRPAAGGELNLVPLPLHLRSRSRVCLYLSHGLSTPTEVVNRKKSIDGGWAAHSSGVTAAWRAPQACGIVGGPPEGSAMEVSTVSPRQPSTIPVTEISPAGERVGTVEGAQPVLAGPEGLPARGRGQRLTLCKETTDLLFTGKLSENSSVPQHTPGEGEAHVSTQRPEAPTDSSEGGTRVSRTHQVPSTPSRLPPWARAYKTIPHRAAVLGVFWGPQTRVLREGAPTPALQAGGLPGGAQSSQLTCAETSVPSPPLPWSCSGPKRFRAGGSGGMLSGGRAACTGCAESSRRSRRQRVPVSCAARREDTGEAVRVRLSSSLACDVSLLVPLSPGLTAVMGYGAPSPPPLVPEPYLRGLWTPRHFPCPQFLS